MTLAISKFHKLVGEELQNISVQILDSAVLNQLDRKIILKIIYPEYRTILEEDIISWAKDLCIDDPELYQGNLSELSLQDAIEILEDLGLVTFARGGGCI